MITISKYALIATSAVAALTTSGCSSILGKPDSQEDSSKVQHAQTKQQKAVLQKASFQQRGTDGNIQPANYHQTQNQKASIDEDFDTWERVFHGFQLNGNYNQHPNVQYFVNYYGRKPAQLSLLSERASVFLHMIVYEIDRRGMPTEIALLPFVESAFDPDIFSSAGAAGLWQFIPDTGRRYGLQQAKHYDARMDPFAATGAALSYLQELHDEFNGDWLLALAAYNCGEKRVQREIDNNRAAGLPADFWHLSGLPKETREYVPRLLAFKELIRNAPRYGVSLADTPNRARLAQVRVNKPVDLRRVALMAGLNSEHLINLNPCFRTGVTTPEYSNRIVLPRSQAQQLAQIIESQPPAASRQVYASKSSSGYNRLATVKIRKKPVQYANAKSKSHTVRRGETLQTIAQKHGMTVEALMKTNSKHTSRIRVGERLDIIA